MADAALSATGLDPTAIPPPPTTGTGTQPAPETTPFTHPPPFHLSLNPAQPTTLLLLHGLLSSHLEYTHVIPHLSAYHLLLVDLPGHSNSFSASTPPLPQSYTLPSMADALAPLIRTHAHNGRAHVVGLSMGGYVALELARRHPDLCCSVWVTGAAPLGGLFAWMAARPAWVDGFMWAVEVLPERVYEWMVGMQGMRPHREVRGEMKRNRRWEVLYGVYGSILEGEGGWERVGAVDGRVRVLTVAGGKQDDVEATRRMGRVWREMGREGCKAAVVREAVHAWDLQMPELFAEGVKAWVEGRELPGEFELLE